jgi:hypothetical protein
MLRSAASKGRLALLAGGGAAALLTAAAWRADLMVSHGFNKAIGGQAVLTPLEPQRTAGASGVTQDRDAGYWLTRSEVESPALFDRQLAVGDRITIAGRDGRERVLEVVDLKVVGESLVQAVAGAAPMRLLLVTCHIVGGDGDQAAKVPVRFIVEGEPSEPALPRPTAAPKA